MMSLLLLLAMTSGTVEVQDKTADSPAASHEIRARPALLFGRGESSKTEYWDVVITRQPRDGVLIKLPYTRKGGKLTFDLHHRVAMSPDFGLPAEITTVVEVLTGGTTSLGQYTLVDHIETGQKFDEAIQKVSTAEIDRNVSPMFRKSVSIETKPGPQSISIVGQSVVITRGSSTTRIDTPGTRIASVSNIKFVEITEINPLKKSSGQ